MEIKDFGNLIKIEIDDQYGNATNFCKKNKITYMPFVNKLSNIRKGQDFRVGPIIKTLKLLGYELVAVKTGRNKKT